MLSILASVFTILTLLSTTFSQPLTSRAVPSQYKLQTRIVNNKNDTGTFKGRLWVQTYHTGAALNDAVLTKNKTAARTGSLNGTIQEFQYGTFNYFLHMVDEPNYSAWQPVQINAFGATEGFSINSTGLQWNETFSFGGWLACDWFHGVPQLFWLNSFYNYTMPTSCSEVDLIPVSI